MRVNDWFSFQVLPCPWHRQLQRHGYKQRRIGEHARRSFHTVLAWGRICGLGGALAGILRALQSQEHAADSSRVLQQGKGMMGHWRAKGLECVIQSHSWWYGSLCSKKLFFGSSMSATRQHQPTIEVKLK